MLHPIHFLLGFLFFLYSLGALALNPSGHWMSHHTPHFEVIYPKGLDELAAQYAYSGEQARELLLPLFRKAPQKTIVVIDPSQDFTNGFATFFPYPYITIYPTLPDNLESIDNYGNWALTLMIHEYTHILTFEPVHGIYTPLKYVFGHIIKPNVLLPTWFHEGLAVEMETRFTEHGRLRSPRASAHVRALVQGNRLSTETIDRINEGGIPSWPFGRRRYLMGALLWDHIIDQHGVESVFSLLQDHGHQLPYLLKGPAIKNLGHSYEDLLKKTYQQIETQAQSQIARIQALPSPSNQLISLEGLVQHSPSMSPKGGHWTFINFQRYRGHVLTLVDKNKKVIKRIRGMNFSKASWAPDGQSFIYDKLGPSGRHNTYYDLYQYHLPTQKSKKLTHGERAREPSFSPDGNRVAYIKTRPGGTALYMLNLSENRSFPLYEAPLQIRLSQPEFINEHEILYIKRNLSGKDSAYVYNTQTHVSRRVLEEFESISYPKNTKEGVLFASHRSGTYNLYLTDSHLQSTYPLTNTTTEVINGDWDPIHNQIYITKLTAQGPKIFLQGDTQRTSPPKTRLLTSYSHKLNSQKPEESQKLQKNISQITDPTAPSLEVTTQQNPPSQQPEQNTPLPQSSATPPALSSTANTFSPPAPAQNRNDELQSRPYNPLPHLVPTYWVPFIYPIEGGILFQGVTSMSDPLQRHNYKLAISSNTLTQKTGGELAYIYNISPANVGISHHIYQEPILNGSQTLTHQITHLQGNFPLVGWLSQWRGQLSVHSIKTDQFSQTIAQRQGFSFGLSYTNQLQLSTGSSRARYKLSVKHTKNYQRKGLDKTPYDRSYGYLGYSGSYLIPDNHTLSLQSQVALAPRLNNLALGDKTLGGKYIANIFQSSFLLRGYPSGDFIGRKIINFNLEYNFPIADIFMGSGLWPLFFKQLHNQLFVDYASVEGVFVNKKAMAFQRVNLDRGFWGVGTEFKLSLTVGYHIPIELNIGLYYGLDREARGGFTPFLGIGVTGL